MDLSPASACCALVIMTLNGNYARTWRCAQVAIIAASMGGLAVSISDRAWLYVLGYLIAGTIAVRRFARGP